MHSPNPIDFCYLLMHPHNPSKQGDTIDVPVPRDAPYFYELDMEYRSLKSVEKRINGVAVRVSVQTIGDEVWLAECYYQLVGPLNAELARHKQALQAALRQSILEESGYTGQLIEEYTIVLIRHIQQTPDEFVDTFGPILAQLVRVVDKPLNVSQTNLILQSRTRYAEDDLTIVDWEGAIVISKAADFRTEIELFKIGNYQLLMYRVVDAEIDAQLKRLKVFVGRSLSWLSNGRAGLRAIINRRLELMLDFESTDQSLLLIGDWYSSQLYRLIFDEFYIEDWKGIVSKKLENLSSIAEVIRQDLTLSWSRLFDILQVVGWMVLLVGYFYLYLRDAGIIR